MRNTGKFFDWFQTLVPDYEFEQVINDLGWAISSGYTAGSKAVDYVDGKL